MTDAKLPAGTWRADPMLSSVTFSVRHMGIRMFRAGFREIDAVLDGDAGRLSGRVALASVDINLPDIRARVLSTEFLDAARFPDVTFEASSLRGGEGGRDIVVEGELTVHGVARPVAARGRIGEPGPGFGGGDHLPLELSATIDRRDFGLDGQEELDGGGAMLAYEVTLEAILDLVQSP